MEPSESSVPSASKWLDNTESEESESEPIGLRWANSGEQFGGSKLRAPHSLSAQIDLVKNGKQRIVIKRRKRKFDEEFSDEEEDPYTQVKVEDILSPIETPSDIVHRPTLRRILKSPQMELLANTSMEFIESEKAFNKILSRLASILYCDDPQYLDVTYSRSASTQSGNDEYAMAVDSKSENQEKPKSVDSELRQNGYQNGYEKDITEDEEAQQILIRVRELLQENINFSNEYLNRLGSARAKLTRTSAQKKQLWKRLKVKAIEQERKRIQHLQQQAQRETNGAASVLSSLARNTSPGLNMSSSLNPHMRGYE
ncbi:hypothetical protein NQZ79_g1565 [Umbelopsis isabellina]|nr:hypothetical protein NQZ79_g1565 [Umbelopsis isabellina]